MLALSRKSVPAIHRALRSIQRRHFATPTPNVTLHSHSNDSQNLVEKIVQRYAVDLPEGQLVRSGDYVTIQPEYIMTHDNTGAVMQKFATIGATKFRNPGQVVFTLDHDVQNRSEKNLQKYSTIESFAHQMSVDFYPAGRGIGHQIMIEEGYAFPNTLTVASDSHSNMYGGVGALGTPVVRTDAAAIWATGRTWWQIPPVVKVDLFGSLPPGVTGKDIIVTLCGAFSHDEVLNCAVEFGGDLGQLSIDDRLAIANMTTEWGALAGIFPVDHVTLTWLRNRVRRVAFTRFDNQNIPSTSSSQDFTHPRINSARIDDIEANPLRASPQARYSKRLTLDLSTLTPHISGPNSVKVYNPLSTLAAQNIAIQKAYLVSCVNSRASDIRAAAEVVRGRKIADGVEFYVAAASSEIQKECEEGGHWQALLDAGARPLPAGCGPCIGLGTGLLKDGEVGISATNRNFKGRMGSPLAKAYLASPVVVAASAIAGKITGPEGIMDGLKYLNVAVPKTQISVESEQVLAPPKDVDTLSGFPREIAGELLFVTQDNLNTDGIYPGKYTYQDDIKREEMKKVVMENYDREFAGIVKDSDILIAGSNFGTGSSREQAATALLSAGIHLVLAASFSDIFKRNSINNALLVAECPELVQDLRQNSPSKELTVRPGWTAKADVAKGEVIVQRADGTSKKYRIGALGKSVQELWCAGGLEGWVKERL